MLATLDEFPDKRVTVLSLIFTPATLHWQEGSLVVSESQSGGAQLGAKYTAV